MQDAFSGHPQAGSWPPPRAARPVSMLRVRRLRRLRQSRVRRLEAIILAVGLSASGEGGNPEPRASCIISTTPSFPVDIHFSSSIICDTSVSGSQPASLVQVLHARLG
jgi:hypothetical protein